MEVTGMNTFQQAIDISNAQELHLCTKTFSKGEFFVTCKEDATSLDLVLDMEENSSCSILLLNQVEKEVTIHVTMNMNRDSYCKMGVLDVQNAPMTWNQKVNLLEEGANFELISGQLCLPNMEKTGNLEVEHLAGNTYGEMKNFAVLSDEGKYEMVANGNIKNGCHEAQSHQATRVLTLGKGHSAKVVPLLLIDENQVKASHALSIGQPDEDQLYYLQSRGLTKRQSLGLLSVGYFMPVIEMIQDEKMQEEVRMLVESKVGLYGNK
ncbi:MAG: SufD family Fe-S cluster assembly protein [Firmicutes bacterium]|nr:SufD family Fe-S cluster assembly protein [Bacillota bacterium]